MSPVSGPAGALQCTSGPDDMAPGRGKVWARAQYTSGQTRPDFARRSTRARLSTSSKFM